MNNTNIIRYTLDFRNIKTYIVAGLFVVGNLVLPQLCHLIPNGGHIFLPIYFFTLIAAYKYGWKVGLITAILSPLVNSMFFGMPPSVALPPILLKSILLAITAGLFAKYVTNSSIWVFVLIVLTYQIVGTLGEWAIKGDFMSAISDFRMGLLGMMLQIFGGFLLVKYILKK